MLVSGCHFADCHYISAVHWTQKRVEKLWDELEKKGIRPERLQLEWISAAEGQKFATVMRAVEELRQRLVDFLSENEEIATPQFKEMTGASRKFVIPLLEYFDAQNLTIRIGDTRKLRKKV